MRLLDLSCLVINILAHLFFVCQRRYLLINLCFLRLFAWISRVSAQIFNGFLYNLRCPVQCKAKKAQNNVIFTIFLCSKLKLIVMAFIQ